MSIPFPQSSTQTYEISGVLNCPISLGVFDLSSVARVAMEQVRTGNLYRIVSYAIAANVPETEFIGAFVPSVNNAFPVLRLTYSNSLLISPKPFPLRNFGNEKETLIYFAPPANNSGIGFSAVGVFDGTKLPGLTTLSLSFSFTMQELNDARFLKAYDERKF